MLLFFLFCFSSRWSQEHKLEQIAIHFYSECANLYVEAATRFSHLTPERQAELPLSVLDNRIHKVLDRVQILQFTQRQREQMKQAPRRLEHGRLDPVAALLARRNSEIQQAQVEAQQLVDRLRVDTLPSLGEEASPAEGEAGGAEEIEGEGEEPEEEEEEEEGEEENLAFGEAVFSVAEAPPLVDLEMDKLNRRRAMVLGEIRDSERRYTESLEVIVEHYAKEFERREAADEGPLRAGEAATLFSNLETIYHLNKRFLRELVSGVGFSQQIRKLLLIFFLFLVFFFLNVFYFA